MAQAGLTHIECLGMNAYGDTAAGEMPQSLAERYLAAEMHTIGRVSPDKCYFHLLSAEKPQ
jgi:hypothetical protein